jgi:hypothetical protein
MEGSCRRRKREVEHRRRLGEGVRDAAGGLAVERTS